jgi:hypothetical protein
MSSVEVQSFTPPPQRLLVKIVTRDVTRCLDDTHIFQTSDRIKAPEMCVSAIQACTARLAEQMLYS